MNKFLTFTLATAMSAVLLADPVTSQIVVTPAVTHQAFVEKVSHDLDRQLEAASWGRSAPTGEGIVIVRFTRDDAGTAENLSLYRASGRRTLDRVAMRAVSRLRSMRAVPQGVEDDQVFQANIIFAKSYRGFDELEDQLASEESRRIARGGAETAVFAFGSAASNPTS